MLVLLFVVVINGFLGLLIFTRNTRSTINRLFLLLTFATYMWSIASYLTDNAPVGQRLWWGKVAFFFPVLVTLCLALLSRIFPVKLKTSTRELLYVSSVAIFGMFISLTSLVVKGASFHSDGTDLIPGSLYLGFIAVELILFGYSIRSYVLSRRHSNTMQRLQVKLVAYGFMISFLWALLFNVLLPLVVTSWAPAKLGPAGTVIFVSFTAYAIIRHRLFDIRLIVARSIAYVTSLAVLASIYGLLVFGAASLVFHLHFSLGVQIFLATATALASLSFANIKSFFDRATNQLFYRDAYDAQAFLDQFNKVLVSTYELDVLLHKSAETIENNLKPTYCLTAIKPTQAVTARFLGTTQRPAFSKQDITMLDTLMGKARSKVFIADETEGNESLQKVLQQKNIAVVVRLASATSQEGIGYLILGSKKSGNVYSSQDLSVIEIIANELVIAIQNALRFEEIENFNLTLQQKVDDATRKLRHVNERLKAMDETKDDFISMASHQLRTPLTSIKGYISMVLEGDAGKVTRTQREMLGQAFFSSQRMVYLIADLLNISRLKTGKFLIEPAKVNLAEVVEQELGQLEETAASRSLTLQYEQPKDFPDLLLDETKTRQVIMNFVDNAIYYTPAGGHITVRLVNNPASVELRVEDDGIGVPKAEQPHLFTKFYRAGNARKARPDGTGLGLFMAKKVIVAQQGSLIFESRENKGSTFGFVFSKSKLAAATTAEK